jgi:hypothetical protein
LPAAGVGSARRFIRSGGSQRLFVLKFTPDGTLAWQRIFGPASGDGVAVAPDGSLYVVGTAARPGGLSEFDVVLL